MSKHFKNLFNLLDKLNQTYAKAEEGVSITIDAALSGTSENPVQNKVVKGALDTLTDILRPDTWTPNTKINFGNGLYGYRKTGTITIQENQRNELALYTAPDGYAVNTVDFGGKWPLFADASINVPGTRVEYDAAHLTLKCEGNVAIVTPGQYGIIVAEYYSLQGVTDGEYDIWLLFTETPPVTP